MNEVKNNDTQVRAEYEPVNVRVMKVTPQGVLCQSGLEDGLMMSISSYSTNSKI